MVSDSQRLDNLHNGALPLHAFGHRATRTRAHADATVVFTGRDAIDAQHTCRTDLYLVLLD